MCEDCANKFFTAVMSTGKQCGHRTTCGSQQYCQKCAITKKVCRACGKSLDDKKKPTP